MCLSIGVPSQDAREYPWPLKSLRELARLYMVATAELFVFSIQIIAK